MSYQLELFKTPLECQIDYLKNMIEDTKKSCEKVRKGSYARLNHLTQEYVDLKLRLEIIERNLCPKNP